MSRQAPPTASEIPLALRAQVRSRMIQSVQDLALALPDDERGMWSQVIITPFNKGPILRLGPSTLNDVRRDLHACLNASPIRAIPFLGVITLIPWKHRGFILPGDISGWTYRVHGLTRIDSRDRRTKTLFKVFMQKGPYFDVVRFHPADEGGRDPSLKGPADLIEPPIEKLQLSKRGRDPELWAELRTALPLLTVGDFIIERGADWYVSLLGEPASGRQSWNSIKKATRRLRQTTPFIVPAKDTDWELLLQCDLFSGSSQTH